MMVISISIYFESGIPIQTVYITLGCFHSELRINVSVFIAAHLQCMLFVYRLVHRSVEPSVLQDIEMQINTDKAKQQKLASTVNKAISTSEQLSATVPPARSLQVFDCKDMCDTCYCLHKKG